MHHPFPLRTTGRRPLRRRPLLAPALFAPALLVLAACGDDTPGTAPDGARQARLAFTTTTGTIGAPLGDGAPAGATDGTAAADEVPAGLRVTSGDDEILITRVQLVVRELELEGPDDDCDDDDDDRPGRRDDDCDDDEIEIGPFLVDLPLTDAALPRLELPVPAGLYEEIELVLHTPDDDDDDDRAFLAANPGFRRISALVEGTFNGQPFTYASRARMKQELEFEPPVVIGDGGESITVDVNVGAWFVRRGGGLISPIEGSMPGEARARIENNIRHTFRAYRDRDRDGRRDD